MGHDIVALLEAGHCTDHNGRAAAEEIKRLRALLTEAERAVVYMCSDGAATWLSLRDRIAAALKEGGK